MNNDIDNKQYYKAYEKRYKQVYEKNMLWSSNLFTPDVMNFINDYNVKKEDRILDLGCGEGRDAINLLEKGYNLLAIDYSPSVIEVCNKLSNNKYRDSFRKFDIFEDVLEDKFKYIYSVAVLHMFVLKEHRNKFFVFLKNHLDENGLCLICVLGDGKNVYSSNINDAFKDVKRVIMNNQENIEVAATSCKVVNWEELEKEINETGLILEKRWISTDIPEFESSMCVVIKKLTYNFGLKNY